MHGIPSCDSPSSCSTEALTCSATARFEPSIGNAEESVPGNLTEKSRVTCHPRTLSSYRPRIRAGYVVFFQETLLEFAPSASDWRGALTSLRANLNMGKRRTTNCTPVSGPLRASASATSSATCANSFRFGPNTHALNAELESVYLDRLSSYDPKEFVKQEDVLKLQASIDALVLHHADALKAIRGNPCWPFGENTAQTQAIKDRAMLQQTLQQTRAAKITAVVGRCYVVQNYKLNGDNFLLNECIFGDE